jgi:hypothetical protein
VYDNVHDTLLKVTHSCRGNAVSMVIRRHLLQFQQRQTAL